MCGGGGGHLLMRLAIAPFLVESELAKTREVHSIGL